MQLALICYYADRSVVSAGVTLRNLVREMIGVASVVSGEASGTQGRGGRRGQQAGRRAHLRCCERDPVSSGGEMTDAAELLERDKLCSLETDRFVCLS